MGSSYVEYRKLGFWAQDGCLEVWLHLMAWTIRQRTSCPEWLIELADEWETQATGGHSGTISSQLDEYLDSETRLSVAVELAHQCIGWLRARESVPSEWLNAVQLGGPGSQRGNDEPLTEPFAILGETFLAVLSADLATVVGAGPIVPPKSVGA
jgi:hypothetical protein